MANGAAQSAIVENVPCPFCALLCDDLRVAVHRGRIEVKENGCGRSSRMFSVPDATPSAAVSGKPATLDAALSHAIGILRSAKHPRIISAGADVAGVRAMLSLAERMQGSVDHVDRSKAFRNLRVVQDAGWIATTLSEVRNRADLLVLAGVDVATHLPRFLERCFGSGASLFGAGAREIWSLGESSVSGATVPVRHLATGNARLPEVFSAVNALLANRRLDAAAIAGVPLEAIEALVARMKAARYGVLAWSAAGLDYPHAELTVQSMAAAVRTLNKETRFAMLPIAGPRADVTAAQATTWQTGIPLQVDFRNGVPEQRVPGADASFDAVIYVAPLATADVPPVFDVPLIVLGHDAAASWKADAYVPVATPGVDAVGHYFRMDGVVSLRMRQLVDRGLLPAAAVLGRLGAALEVPS